MTSHLARLALRAARPGTGLRPRTMSMFESPTAMLTVREDAGPTSLVTDWGVATGVSVDAIASQPRGEVPSDRAGTRPSHPHDTPRHEPPDLASEPEPRGAAALVDRFTGPAPPPSRPPVVEEDSAAGRATVQAVVEGQSRPPTVTPPSLFPALEPHHGEIPLFRGERKQVSTRLPSETPPPPHSGASREAPPTAAAAPIAAPESARLPRLRLAPPSAEGGTTPEVTVNIGRIEVLTPPSREAKADRARPRPRATGAPNLAEYLRERNRR